MQNTKSATTAGLLGIFLGAFGAHNWYLGEKNKGIAHVCMMGAGILVEIISGVILPNVMTLSALLTAASIISVLGSVALLAMSASGIWGLVEGIQLLVGGDAGLATKGYPVAAPVNQMPMNQGYPGNYNQGYNQPYYGQPQPPYNPGPQPNQPEQPQNQAQLSEDQGNYNGQ